MEWLTGNWYMLAPREISLTLLAAAAAVAGSMVGIDRELKEKPAGLRTMTLVCLGAAVFSMVSISLSGDPGRVAAQVVTGIGFLGAGAIIRGSQGVTGMTTAASIWMVAAIGMVIGIGHGGAGLALSLGTLVLLRGFARLERRYLGACSHELATVRFDPGDGKAQVIIEDLLDAQGVDASRWKLSMTTDGYAELQVDFCVAHRHHDDFLARLAALPEVREIRTSASVSHGVGEGQAE